MRDGFGDEMHLMKQAYSHTQTHVLPRSDSKNICSASIEGECFHWTVQIVGRRETDTHTSHTQQKWMWVSGGSLSFPLDAPYHDLGCVIQSTSKCLLWCTRIDVVTLALNISSIYNLGLTRGQGSLLMLSTSSSTSIFLMLGCMLTSLSRERERT